jgi:hypothetical protein
MPEARNPLHSYRTYHVKCNPHAFGETRVVTAGGFRAGCGELDDISALENCIIFYFIFLKMASSALYHVICSADFPRFFSNYDVHFTPQVPIAFASLSSEKTHLASAKGRQDKVIV